MRGVQSQPQTNKVGDRSSGTGPAALTDLPRVLAAGPFLLSSRSPSPPVAALSQTSPGKRAPAWLS